MNVWTWFYQFEMKSADSTLDKHIRYFATTLFHCRNDHSLTKSHFGVASNVNSSGVLIAIFIVVFFGAYTAHEQQTNVKRVEYIGNGIPWPFWLHHANKCIRCFLSLLSHPLALHSTALNANENANVIFTSTRNIRSRVWTYVMHCTS